MCKYKHRSSNRRSLLVVVPFVFGGLLLHPLKDHFVNEQAAASDSGVVTSNFDLAQPATGKPPRPMRSRNVQAKEFRAEIDQDSIGQELSVELGTQPLLPADAPAWIGALPDTTGEVHRVYVGGGIADSERDAAAQLDEALVSAVCDYIDTALLPHRDTRSGLLQRRVNARGLTAKITSDFIWKNLVDDPDGYLARLNTGDAPMFQKWVTVSITPQQRDMIRSWEREATQRQRLAPVGVGMLGLLSCVGLLHLVFRGRKPRR